MTAGVLAATEALGTPWALDEDGVNEDDDDEATGGVLSSCINADSSMAMSASVRMCVSSEAPSMSSLSSSISPSSSSSLGAGSGVCGASQTSIPCCDGDVCRTSGIAESLALTLAVSSSAEEGAATEGG